MWTTLKKAGDLPGDCADLAQVGQSPLLGTPAISAGFLGKKTDTPIFA